MAEFDVNQFDVERFDAILARGLSTGVGARDGQMCIEAAICTVLDLPHGDDPGCVARSVRAFKIALNDRKWSSSKARAEGLRDLGLAQLGSLGVVNDKEFVTKLVEKLIRVLIPKLIRELYPSQVELVTAIERCEREGTKEACRMLQKLLIADAAAFTADAAADAAAVAGRDIYLQLVAELALEILIELKSPGVCLLSVKAPIGKEAL